MSASTRNRRATVYPLVGQSTGGFVTPTYGVARGTYWCRVSPIPGQESVVDAQMGAGEAAILEVADEVPVEETDLIVVDDVQWKAGPVTLRRQARAKVLRVERSTEAATFITGEAAVDVPEYVEAGHSTSEFDAPQDVLIDGGGADAVFTETIDAGGA